MRATSSWSCALLCLVFGLGPGAAATAQQPTEATPRTEQGPAEEATAEQTDGPPPSADDYTRQVRLGLERLMAADSAGAVEAFRAASELHPERPQAPYYLAVSRRMAGELEPALEGFRRAAQVAQARSEPRWQARALQAVAFTLERMEGRLEEARAAWEAYVSFADAHRAVAHPDVGRARMQAIDMRNEQERAYVGVRERIAERERERAEEEAEQSSSRRRRGR